MKVLEKKILVSKNDLDDLNHVNNVVYIQWIQEIAKEHWEKLASNEILDNYRGDRGARVQWDGKMDNLCEVTNITSELDNNRDEAGSMWTAEADDYNFPTHLPSNLNIGYLNLFKTSNGPGDGLPFPSYNSNKMELNKKCINPYLQ